MWYEILSGNHQISDNQEFMIEIKPDVLNITFPNGLLFDGVVDTKKNILLIGLKPAQYRLKTEENTTNIEIDLQIVNSAGNRERELLLGRL